MSVKKRKLLIQRADRLGDVVFTLPILETIRKNYPDYEIHYLVSPISKGLVSLQEGVEKVHVIDWSEGSKLTLFFELVELIRQENYDGYLCLWNDPWMAWLGWLAKIPVRIGDQSNKLLSWLFTHGVSLDWLNLSKHQVSFNLDLLEPLMVAPSVKRASIKTSVIHDLKMSSHLDAHFKSERPIVTLLCSTGGSSSPIPIPVMVQFVTKLLELQKFNIVLCGDQPISQFELMGEQAGLLNILGETSLEDAYSLIKASEIVVGGDTGLMHVAGMMNKPVVFYSPFKSQFPTRWGPLSDYFTIIRKDYLSAHSPSKEHQEEPYHLDADYIYDQFCQLLSMMDTQDYYDEKQAQIALMKKSFRLLYVYRDVHDFEMISDTLEKLREEGIVIVSLYLGRFPLFKLPRLIRVILEKNVTFIFSQQFSSLLWRFIRLIVGVGYQYHPTQLIRFPLNQFIRSEEVMTLCHNAYDRVSLELDL